MSRRFGRPIGNADSLSFIYDEEISANGAREEPKEGIIEVDHLELYAKENGVNHRTDQYEIVSEQMTPVLRRSDTFYLAIATKDREANLNQDDFRLIFEFGKNGTVPKGTKSVLLVTNKYRLDNPKSKWDVIVHRKTGRNVILQIRIGSAAPVGTWKCKVETSKRETGFKIKNTYIEKKPVYILFNPYSPEDSTYYPNEVDLKEYLLNDSGKIFKGNHNRPQGRHWVFGQFEDCVLPACCFILNRSGLSPTERGNPIKVSRAISAMVNSVDDNGILKGRWNAPYDDGTAPWDWSGSVKILEKYLQSQGEPVKYGQCWVFSAVTVTICRALGIPCRSVTNYVSAHDTNQSLTVDKFFSVDGEQLTINDNPEFGFDSIWNFHVWNDVWMARPDLPAGYGGWQAIDSTPQEASDKRYQCGPAPLEAVRKGEVGMGFDVPFVFAEVNADICHFVEDDESSWGFKKTKLDKYHVGKLILTKGAGFLDEEGDRDAEDVTWQYKNSEGTHAERLAVFNAVKCIDKAIQFYDIPSKEQEDVRMSMVELEKVDFGQPYKVSVLLENLSSEDRTIRAFLSSSSVFYFGVTAKPIMKAQGEFILYPGQRDTLSLFIEPSDYMEKLVDYCMIKMYSMIKVKETNQTWSEEDDFQLEKPKLNVQVVEPLYRGKLGQVVIRMKNPLNVPLTNCKVSIEAASAIKEIRENVPNVEPNGVFTHKFIINPRKAGTGTVVSTFSSNEMVDVFGSSKFDVLSS